MRMTSWGTRALLAVVLSATAGALPAVASTQAGAGGRHAGTTYFIDCGSGSDSASGTSPGSAWDSLEKASAVTYGAGDRILFRRGSTCDGVFAPTGSGAEGAPVKVDAYGKGAKPRIRGGGARAAVLLENVEQWELRNLDVSNKGAAPGPTERRAGILFRLTDFGTGEHYVVDDVDVHDVNGSDHKDPDPSGGILFVVRGTATPTRFDGITVTDSTVQHVDRTGISTASSWGRRPEHPHSGAPGWAPNTDLTIRNNKVIDVGGDGIVLQHGHHALVEHNYVDGFNMRSAGYNVGIWAWNFDDAVYQYNEVTGGHGTLDSQAFDFDGGNNRNVYQYNYSHDNEGGFLLVCNATGMTSADNVFRYNVSIGDRNTWSPPYGVISVVCPAATTNTQVYNNTVVTGETGTAMVSDNGKGGVTFRNNIFVSTAEGGSPIVDALNTYDHNLYVGVGAVPASDANAVTADPEFLDATPESPRDLRLRPGSPALGAGTPIENAGGHDYFGNRLHGTTDIGAHQRPGSR
ncbi:right-handed parallel beta-helix repeat-containing protein [Streptomyces sp. NPDC056222]|uniref:right-handed parallel beta-helix repeat-containing protein n=1 Tax=Streptomyces sp. NPDC056222 TaxID=3345749 RepID=UPI0035E0329E